MLSRSYYFYWYSRSNRCIFREAKRFLRQPSNFYQQLPKMVKDSKIQRERSYEDAVSALNGLESNSSVLAKIRRDEKRNNPSRSIEKTLGFMQRLDVNVNDLDKLNIIHISGTKGKGSVSAFCESILRHSGLQTGFSSSPHLVEVRERIRINGTPIVKEKFTKYFFECFDKLAETAAYNNGGMPGYFCFLTLMMYYVFLKEQVDVAIVEVGIGGTYDCTNVMRNPTVCGICKLEMDHVGVLGNTIEKIAWHKAGIMKPGHPAFTFPQVNSAERVLFDRAEELQTTLQIVPSLDAYDQDLSKLQFPGQHQQANAALAIQLCKAWLQQKKYYATSDDLLHLISNTQKEDKQPKEAQTFHIPNSFIEGLKNTKLFGRCHMVKKKSLTFYIDGSHTTGSIEACVNWVKSRQDDDVDLPREKVARVLLFNLSGERDNYGMLKLLSNIDFDHAVFCPSILEPMPGVSLADITDSRVTKHESLKTCVKNKCTWLSIHGFDSNIDSLSENEPCNIAERCPEQSSLASIFPSIGSAIRWISNGKDMDIEKADIGGPTHPDKLLYSQHVQVVVVGSLYLAGGVIKFLGPKLCGLDD